MKLSDCLHVKLASGRKPDVLDYAAGAMLGVTLAVVFMPAFVVLGTAKALGGKIAKETQHADD